MRARVALIPFVSLVAFLSALPLNSLRALRADRTLVSFLAFWQVVDSRPQLGNLRLYAFVGIGEDFQRFRNRLYLRFDFVDAGFELLAFVDFVVREGIEFGD